MFKLFAELTSGYHSDGFARWVCNSVLALSFVFIAATIIVDFAGYIRKEPLSIYRYVAVYMDRSVPEIFGYALALGTAYLLLRCYARFGIRMFAFWACFFIFVAVDDAVGYHEQFGVILVETMKLPALPGLRPVDSGELMAWALAGVVLLVPLGWSLMERAPGTGQVFWLFACVVGLLVVFGMGVDMLHEVFAKGSPMRRILNWAEDGGELLVLSIAFGMILLLYRSPNEALLSGRNVAA